MSALHSSIGSGLTASDHSEWLNGSLNPNQFALRYRDCPPEPPADLLKTLEPKPENHYLLGFQKIILELEGAYSPSLHVMPERELA